MVRNDLEPNISACKTHNKKIWPDREIQNNHSNVFKLGQNEVVHQNHAFVPKVKTFKILHLQQ